MEQIMRLRTAVLLGAALALVPALAVADDDKGNAEPRGLLGKLAPEANESHLYSVHYSPDGKLIVTVLNKKVHIWSTATWKELRQFTMKDDERRLEISPDGKTFAWMETGKVDLYDIEKGEVVKSLDTTPDFGDPNNFVFSHDGKMLVAGGSMKNYPVVWLWDIATGKARVFHGPEVTDVFYTVAITDDGKTLAVGLESTGEVLLYDVESGKELRRCKTGDRFPKHITFSHDGKLLATCGFGEPVRVFDVETAKVTCKFEMTYAVCVKFMPDDRTVVSSDREQFVLWNLETKKSTAIYGRKGAMIEVHNSQSDANGPEAGLCISPDGKQIAWGCEYEEWGFVRVWDVASLAPAK
jgi:WD40 repeat protein